MIFFDERGHNTRSGPENNPTRRVAASYTQEKLLFVIVGKVIFGHTVIDFISQG